MPSENTGHITRTLAEFALSIDLATLDPAIAHEAERILLDCVGCAVAGLVLPAGQIAVEMARREHGPLEATVVGAGKATVGEAAFANTILNNALDFEPVGPEGHVCAVAVPVALAVAEAVDASGAELLAGLVAGLELGGRVGGATRRVAQGGNKTTPMVRGTAHAVFAAVAAAGRILRLTPDQMHHAFGIAGYSATVPTLKKVMTSNHAPMTKYDHLGLIAQNGIKAALLAQRGFHGDLAVLEGDVGFWRFAGALGCDFDFFTANLGHTWTIPETWFKRYPVILYTTPGVDVALRIADEHGLHPSEIEHVEIRTARANEVQAGKQVRDEMDAWTSYAYNVAVGLHRVRPRRSWQERATYTRPDILALKDRVDLAPLRPEDLTSTGNYWEGWSPARGAIRARGQVFDAAQDYLPRIDDAELQAKFEDNVGSFLAPDDARQVGEWCWNPRALPRARQLGALLATARATSPASANR